MNWTQYRLPLDHTPLVGVLGTVSFAATDDGWITVGATATDLTSLDQLLIVATPPCTRQDLATRGSEVQAELLGIVASLLDWPPFP